MPLSSGLEIHRLMGGFVANDGPEDVEAGAWRVLRQPDCGAETVVGSHVAGSQQAPVVSAWTFQVAGDAPGILMNTQQSTGNPPYSIRRIPAHAVAVEP